MADQNDAATQTFIEGLAIPLEELFQYHPPKTQERIEKHNAVNEGALKLAKVVLEISNSSDSFWDDVSIAISAFRLMAEEACKDSSSLDRALGAVEDLEDAIADVRPAVDRLHFVQVARMTLNQGIVIDSLKGRFDCSPS